MPSKLFKRPCKSICGFHVTYIQLTLCCLYILGSHTNINLDLLDPIGHERDCSSWKATNWWVDAQGCRAGTEEQTSGRKQECSNDSSFRSTIVFKNTINCGGDACQGIGQDDPSWRQASAANHENTTGGKTTWVWQSDQSQRSTIFCKEGGNETCAHGGWRGRVGGWWGRGRGRGGRFNHHSGWQKSSFDKWFYVLAMIWQFIYLILILYIMHLI